MKERQRRKSGEKTRLQLRWEDCVKTDQRKAEEEEKWRENKATAKMGGLCEDR